MPLHHQKPLLTLAMVICSVPNYVFKFEEEFTGSNSIKSAKNTVINYKQYKPLPCTLAYGI